MAQEPGEVLRQIILRTAHGLHALLGEIDYLRRYDEAVHRIMEAVEMPEGVGERLPAERLEAEFHMLRDDEVTLIEGIVGEALERF